MAITRNEAQVLVDGFIPTVPLVIDGVAFSIEEAYILAGLYSFVDSDTSSGGGLGIVAGVGWRNRMRRG